MSPKSTNSSPSKKKRQSTKQSPGRQLAASPAPSTVQAAATGGGNTLNPGAQLFNPKPLLIEMDFDPQIKIEDISGDDLARGFEKLNDKGLLGPIDFDDWIPILSLVQLKKIYKHFVLPYRSFTKTQKRAYSGIVASITPIILADIADSDTSNKLKSGSTDYSKMKLLESCSASIYDGQTRLPPDADATARTQFQTRFHLAVFTRNIWMDMIQHHLGISAKISVDKFMSKFKEMTEDKICGIDFSKGKYADASLSMYNSLTLSISSKFNTELRVHESKIHLQGPRFLWFILQRITEKDAIILKEVTAEIAKLQQSFEDSGWDLLKLCPPFYSRVMLYEQAGGGMTTAEQTIKRALLACPNINFNQELRKIIDDTTQKGSSTPNPASFNTFETLRRVPMLVQEFIAEGNWNFTVTKQDRIPKKPKKPKDTPSTDDISAFQTVVNSTMSNMEEKLESLTAALASKHGNGKPPGKHSVGTHQWGSDKTFTNKEDFLNFLKGGWGKHVQSANGVTWKWCDKCSRMGNHATAACTRPPKAKKKKTGGPPPAQRPSSGANESDGECKSSPSNSPSANISSIASSNVQSSSFIPTFDADETQDEATNDVIDDDESMDENEEALFGILNENDDGN